MTSEKTALKSEQLWELPDDGDIHEIIRGEHVLSKAPSIIHQRVIAKLFTLIQEQIENAEIILSPTGLILDDENGIIPDLIIISDDNAKIIKYRGVFGSPNWIIEVLSPHNKENDLIDKKEIYFKNNIEEYWCVDLERDRIHQFQLKNDYRGIIVNNDTANNIEVGIFDITLNVNDIFQIKPTT